MSVQREPSRINVRCCCEPGKVLGTLPFRGGRLLVVPTTDGYEEIEYRVAAEVMASPSRRIMTELAVPSHGHSIEFWREVSGFIEGDETDDLRRFDDVP